MSERRYQASTKREAQAMENLISRGLRVGGKKNLEEVPDDFDKRQTVAALRQERIEAEKELNPIDRFVLARGLVRLHTRLSETPEHDFPQVIIFLDSGARPLAYAFKPLVEKVCKERGLALPKLAFLGLGSGAPTLAHPEQNEIEFRRIKTIVETAAAKKVWLIDDTVVESETIQNALRIFTKFTPEERPDLFAFIFYGLEAPRFRQEPGFTFEIGTDIQDVRDHEFEPGTCKPKYPSSLDWHDRFDYGGFSYRGTKFGVPYEVLQKEKAMRLGVEKTAGSALSARSPFADPEQMKKLRRAMVFMAKEVLRHNRKLEQENAGRGRGEE